MTRHPASEAFDTAMSIEQVGKEFYETLAIACDDHGVTELCKALARQEASHLAAFGQLRKSFEKAGAKAQPDAYSALSVLARQQIMPDPASVHRAAVGRKLCDALAMAMQLERGSIRFYNQLATQLPTAAAAIGAIIDAEKRHLAQLHAIGD